MEFLPTAKIGKIQQNTVDIEGKDITSLLWFIFINEEYEDGTFESFGLAIFDDVICLGAEVFFKINGKGCK